MIRKIILLGMALGVALLSAAGEDITTLDGTTYTDVKDVTVKRDGMYFVAGTGSELHGVTVTYTNLSDETKEKHHYDPYEVGMAYAQRNERVNLTKNLAFSLDNLEAAKKKAAAEKKPIGFIMEWDTMLVPARPMEGGSAGALAHFFEVFNGSLVLVFVRHESELDQVPDAVKTGFQGPEEGGFAPNMAVVTADCSKFICEIPYGGKESDGAIREKIFREKIAVIKKFIRDEKAAQ